MTIFAKVFVTVVLAIVPLTFAGFLWDVWRFQGGRAVARAWREETPWNKVWILSSIIAIVLVWV